MSSISKPSTSSLPSRPPLITSIAVNAFKGGVGKTTCVLNFAWHFARKNIKVLMVDADAQCNLTQLFLSSFDFEEFTKRSLEIFRLAQNDEHCASIGEALDILIQGHELPELQPIQFPTNENVYLLPGSRKITLYEEQLATVENSGIPYGGNIPGGFFSLIQNSARAVGAQLILIDTSPSIGCLNMVTIMSSTYFMMPLQGDFFSLKAVEALKDVVCNDWVRRMSDLRSYAKARKPLYSLPKSNAKFLGSILQMFTVQRGNASLAFRTCLDAISREIADNLIPALHECGMAFTLEEYQSAGLVHKGSIRVAAIQNFHRYAPMAQSQGLPLVALAYDHTKIVRYGPDNKAVVPSGAAADRKTVKKMIEPIETGGNSILKIIGFTGGW